jgi:hypothetical protein
MSAYLVESYRFFAAVDAGAAKAFRFLLFSVAGVVRELAGPPRPVGPAATELLALLSTVETAVAPFSLLRRLLAGAPFVIPKPTSLVSAAGPDSPPLRALALFCPLRAGTAPSSKSESTCLVLPRSRNVTLVNHRCSHS